MATVSENMKINNVLCYIIDEMDVLPTDSIIKLCENGFPEEEIGNARDELYLYATIEMRNSGKLSSHRRRGANQIRNNLNDIIFMVHGIDPDELPCYVAKEIYKLPPVTTDVVDATNLLRQQTQMKIEIASLHEKFDRHYEEKHKIEHELSDIREIATKALAESKRVGTEISKATIRTSTYSEVLRTPSSAPTSVNGAIRKTPSVDNQGTSPQNAHNIQRADISSNKGAVSIDDNDVTTDDDEGFTLVENHRRRKNRNSNLTAIQPRSPKQLKAAPKQQRPKRFFVSRLNVDNTKEDLEEHLRNMNIATIEVREQRTKYDGYKSYMFVVSPESDEEKILTTSLWPENVVIRKYYEKQKHPVKRNNGNERN